MSFIYSKNNRGPIVKYFPGEHYTRLFEIQVSDLNSVPEIILVTVVPLLKIHRVQPCL